METSIRQLEPKDIETLRELNRQVFENDINHIDDLNMTWPDSEVGRKYYQKVVNAVDGTIGFVAEIQGKPVGYVALATRAMNYRNKKYVEIENIGVAPDFRSQGIGEKLVKKAAEWAKTNGADRLLVEAFSQNQRAIDFYQNNDFIQSAITLEKDL